MNDAPTLGDLIRARQETTGWSYRDLAERSPEGAGLNKSRWRELRMDEAKTFSGKQLRGVAAVLGASEQVVGRAALVTMGLTLMSDSGTIRTAAAVHADPSLTERDRRIITAVLREMSAEERGGHGEAAPMNQAGGDPAGTQQDHDDETPTASAVGDEVPEAERGTDAPGPAANAERVERAMSAWTGKAPSRDGAGSRTAVPAGRAGRSESAEGGEAEPDFYSLAADARRTEGMAQRDAIDEAGEESQVPEDDEGA